MVLPALTLVGALMESAVLWHSDEVALVFGAEMPAKAIVATASARIPIVSAFLLFLLRRTASPAASS
jgi:hypothetical protein